MLARVLPISTGTAVRRNSGRGMKMPQVEPKVSVTGSCSSMLFRNAGSKACRCAQEESASNISPFPVAMVRHSAPVSPCIRDSSPRYSSCIGYDWKARRRASSSRIDLAEFISMCSIFCCQNMVMTKSASRAEMLSRRTRVMIKSALSPAVFIKKFINLMSYPKQTPFSHWEKVPEGRMRRLRQDQYILYSLEITGFSHQSKELIISTR